MSELDQQPAGDVTRLLRSYSQGGEASFNELIPIVYRELKAIAHSQLRRSGVGKRMETTMLVHEAYEKLVKGQTQHASDRQHFYAIAARAMRQIIVDTYRSEQTAKRGSGVAPGTLLTSDMVDIDQPDSLLNFDDALQRLANENEELLGLVELSCFAGLSNNEIADLTGSNLRTVQRKLARAQAWIATFLEEQ